MQFQGFPTLVSLLIGNDEDEGDTRNDEDGDNGDDSDDNNAAQPFLKR